MKYYLAIDIGASSGRHIVGWREKGQLKTKELYRFANGVQEENGHLVWDLEFLLDQVKSGIDRALEAFPQIESLSIDTWGCDYVLLRGDAEVLPCYAYRDWRTEAVHEAVHAAVPFSELYRRTGCQFQPFNTIYQLCADRAEGRLEGVTAFLMIPEYLMYRLTGSKAKEYTNATTTGLVNVETGEFDREILSRLGLPDGLFPKLQQPGTEIGSYKGIRVILCATHDTASAVEGIPMEGSAPYISSGTWSLLGVKTPRAITGEASEAANWSNEGGVGCIRYQKNIMGMWLVNRLRSELCPEKPWSEILAEAQASTFDETVNANEERFLSPVSMRQAFDSALHRVLLRPGESDHLVITNMSSQQIDEVNAGRPPLSAGDYFRCAYRSLALCYKAALDELERNTGKSYDKLYIVGGGAKNRFLNELTAACTQKQVIALPIEATAIGNLKIQIHCSGAQCAPQEEPI
ncbi:MAG: rhamnulokinase [Oscillospiraceae bacterium]|nr:rhamnulokinase [Oscillospiraceae bacterium]